MKIVKSSIEILDSLDQMAILKRLEIIGRTCYKSEEKITDISCIEFVKKIISSGHHSIIEHVSVSVRVICDRGVTHEIVRHRIGSYAQESTRYCNYSSDKFQGRVNYIQPDFELTEADKQLLCWMEDHYMRRLEEGLTPQQARYFLPNGLKTEIVITFNLREWRHFLTLRASKVAHPQMREVAQMILNEFMNKLPVIFEDIG